MYERIKKWYAMGLWSAVQVRSAVAKGVLTEDTAAQILGE